MDDFAMRERCSVDCRFVIMAINGAIAAAKNELVEHGCDSDQVAMLMQNALTSLCIARKWINGVERCQAQVQEKGAHCAIDRSRHS
jgi:hypothetical protein